MRVTWKIAIFLVGVLLVSGLHAQEKAKTFSPYVDDQGRISLPEDYRARWAYLGAWAVPMEKAPGRGFHDVFTQPESVESYKKAGQFPDGAVLIKEIRKINAEEMTTGKAYWAGDIVSWFVMIKDQKGRFKNNPNWGDGWGWALFQAKDPQKNVSTDFRKDCIGCHVPAKKTDWVYIQGYPTLK